MTVDLTGNMVPEAKAYPFQELIKAIATAPEDTEEQKLATVLRWINPVATSSISQAMRDAILNKTTYGFTNPLAQQHFQAVRYQIADYEAWLTSLGVDALIFPVATSKTIGTDPNAVGGNSSAPGRTLINSFSLPFVAVPMGVLPTSEPSCLGFLGNKYFADADLMAMVGAYEQVAQKRIVSPLAPPLAEEHIEYDPSPVRPPALDTVRPAISIRSSTDIKGQGEDAKFYLEGAASDNKQVASVTVTIRGERTAEKLTSNGWIATKSMAFIRQLVRKGVRSVKVVAVVKDISGNTTVTTKTIKLPSDDTLDG